MVRIGVALRAQTRGAILAFLSDGVGQLADIGRCQLQVKERQVRPKTTARAGHGCTSGNKLLVIGGAEAQ
jgi:hypothetical protein